MRTGRCKPRAWRWRSEHPGRARRAEPRPRQWASPTVDRRPL